MFSNAEVKLTGSAPQQAVSGYISSALPSAPGHRLTYYGLWLFTLLLIFRPADTFPVLGRLSFITAALTVGVFIVSQLWLEKRPTALPTEIKLVLALCVVGLISIPEGADPANSWLMFSDTFIKPVLMFIIMVNAVRTEVRLHRLLQLVMVAGVYVAYGAIDAFRRGAFSVEGYRVQGNLGATLSDPNDTALFLVMMIPIALAFMLSSKEKIPKILYGLGTALMVGAVFVTYSRGGFLALSFAGLFFGWKMMRRNPVTTGAFIVVALLTAVSLVPPNYTDRLSSIFDSSGDSRGSSSARKNLLERSIVIASRNPIIGVGMGNFPEFSIRGQVSHNTYTQVASEMGFPALAIYLAFLIAPIKRLRRIEKETIGVSHAPPYQNIHYLAIGLQASMIGYMIGSFFLSVAYYWFIYYLVGYVVCLGRIYETGPGRIVGTYQIKENPRA